MIGSDRPLSGAVDTAPSWRAENTATRLVIADGRLGRLWVLDSGNIAGWYGTIGSGTDEFNRPSGLARVGPTGFVIADRGNDRIVTVDDLSGTNWQELGSTGTGEFEFRSPSGVAVDAAGGIWITDSGNRRIVRVDDITGSGWDTYGLPGRPTATEPAVGRFWEPRSLAVTDSGPVLVSDPGAGRVVQIDDVTGAGWTASPFGALGSPTSAVRTGTRCAVADFAAGSVVVLGPALTVLGATSDRRLTGVSAVCTNGPDLYALSARLGTVLMLTNSGATPAVVDELRLGALGIQQPLALAVAP